MSSNRPLLLAITITVLTLAVVAPVSTELPTALSVDVPNGDAPRSPAVLDAGSGDNDSAERPIRGTNAPAGFRDLVEPSSSRSGDGSSAVPAHSESTSDPFSNDPSESSLGRTSVPSSSASPSVSTARNPETPSPDPVTATERSPASTPVPPPPRQPSPDRETTFSGTRSSAASPTRSSSIPIPSTTATPRTPTPTTPEHPSCGSPTSGTDDPGKS